MLGLAGSYLSPEPLAKPKPWGLETKPKSPAGTTSGAGVGMGKTLFALEGEALGWVTVGVVAWQPAKRVRDAALAIKKRDLKKRCFI